MKRFILIILLMLSAPISAFAQSDKDFLTRWLEENLSGAGRTITIDGFAGALSSQSRLDRMTIADDTGIWLVLEDAVLNWKRSALLKGRLEIEELSAARIRITRVPKPATKPTAPEAKEPYSFSLPDLPVAIEIGTLNVAWFELGAGVLGEPLAFSVAGQVDLIDGAGNANLNITRLGAASGTFQFDGRFENDTRNLTLALGLSEDSGGIFAKLLHLPDNPSLSFELKGEGKLPEFAANVSLKTASQQRLAGILRLRGNTDPSQTGQTIFDASLNGDITPLLATDYRRFFGPDTTLKLSGIKSPDGQLSIDALSIITRALNISGSLTLSADGLPKKFDLLAELASSDRTPTILPLPGDPVRLASATLNAHFESDKSDVWSLNTEFTDFDHPALQIASGRIVSNGLMFRKLSGDPTQSVRRVTADIVATFNGLLPTDKSLAKTIGPNLIASTTLDWNANQPLAVNSLTIIAGEMRASASGTIAGNSDGFRISGISDIDTGPLSRIAGLSDQAFRGGSGVLGLQGWWQPFSGAFNLKIDGATKALKLWQKPYYNLIEGDGRVIAAIRRDTFGLHVDQLELETPALFTKLEGEIADRNSDLAVEAKIADVSNLIAGITGPATLSGNVRQSGKPWNIDILATGPAGSRAQIAGSVNETATQADLKIDGSVPVGIANSFLPPDISLQGEVDFDLALNGPLNPKSLTGNIRTGNTIAALPVYGLSFGDITGVANIAGGAAQLDLSANVSGGGRVAIGGQQDIVAPFGSDLKITLRNVRLADPPTFRTTVNGALRLSGPVGAASTVSGTIDLGETEMRLVPASGGSAIPDITHIAETQSSRVTRLRAGINKPNSASALSADDTGIALDVLVRAPSRIFIRGRGLDAEMGGSMQISGTANAVIPSGQFNLLRGRLDLLGKRFDLEDGQLSMQGSLQPTYDLTAITRTPDATIRVIIAGTPDNPEISFQSDPNLPEDEILAQLVFGKGIAKISPLQAVQLASAISTLIGEGGEGVVGNIRNRFGLDDLDVVTTQEGPVAVKAGKYISENTYADVTANSEGKTEINLNLDLNPNFTARGSVTTDGDSGLGLYFEKDY